MADYHLRFGLRDERHGLVFTRDIEVHTLELPKVTSDMEQLDSALDRWVYFLRYGETLDPDRLPAVLDNPSIHKAMEELKMISQSELERERYLARIKLQRDERTRLNEARRQGMERGVQQGIEQGIEQGVLTSRRETLVRLLRRRFGDLPAAVERTIHETTDRQQLDQWLDLLVSAENLDDVGIPRGDAGVG